MRKIVGTKPVATVGELKEALKDVPDDYQLSCMGTEFAIVKDTEQKIVLFDEVNYVEELLEENDGSCVLGEIAPGEEQMVNSFLQF